MKDEMVGHQTKAEYDLVVAKNRAWWIEQCKKHEGTYAIGCLLDYMTDDDKFGTRLYAEDVLARLQEE